MTYAAWSRPHGPGGYGGRGRLLKCLCGVGGVEQNHRYARHLRDLPGDGLGADDQGRPRVLDHVAEPVPGVDQVERQERGAQLHRGEHGGDHVHGPGNGHPDHALGAHSVRGEQTGDAAGPVVELGVRHRAVPVHHGHGVGPFGEPAGEQGGQGLLLDLAGRVVEALQDGPPLLAGKDLGPGQRLSGSGDECGDQGAQPLTDRLRGLPVEQFGGELQ